MKQKSILGDLKTGTIQLAVLSPYTGKVLHRRNFVTSQPSDGRNLIYSLRTFQEDNIIVICGTVSINKISVYDNFFIDFSSVADQ